MKIISQRSALICCLLLLSVNTKGQTPTTLTLDDAIQLAQRSSLDYKIAVNTARSYYWNYERYKAGFLPKLSLSGTLPDYYRSINQITLPNGQNDFVNQDLASSSVNLNLSQNIGMTGGSIAFGSSLRRIDNFGNFRNSSYTAVPFTISYYQDNLFYNDFKWQKKIEPIRLLEAQRGYLENLENISYNTISQYFDLLVADIQLKLDKQNLRNIDTLIKITQARFEIGTVQLNDVLQSKVSLLNAKRSISNSLLSVQTAKQNIIRFLNLDRGIELQLVTPDAVQFFNIDPQVALAKAQGNRKYILEHQRRRLEAEQTLAKTKSETGPSINFRGNLGLTQTGNNLNTAYQDLLRNQSLTIGFNIPLVDWGVNKSNRKRAESTLELEKNNITQEQITAEQEIYYQVMKWSMQKEQMQLSIEATSLSQQRYEIARQKYALGSLAYTDFNNAQLDKDRAVTDYMNNLRDYWSMYYLLRRLTLFDFIKNKKIEITDLKID